METTQMTQETIKARRYYLTKGFPAVGGHPAVAARRVRVTGFETVNGERWCKVRYDGDRAATILIHPTMLHSHPETTF